MSEAAPSLENLRPALAGLIVDNEVGRKDAYATFINLVERKYISASSDGNGGQIFKRTGKSVDILMDYERLVLIPQKKMNEKEVKGYLDEVGENRWFVKEVVEEAVRQKLYNADLLGRLQGGNFNPGLIVLTVFLMSGMLALFAETGLINGKIGLMFTLMILAGAVWTFWFFHRVVMSKEDREWLAGEFLNRFVLARGSANREKYLELLEWLKAHPLSDYRWGNEFLPFAVAFGLYKEYDKFPK